MAFKTVTVHSPKQGGAIEEFVGGDVFVYGRTDASGNELPIDDASTDVTFDKGTGTAVAVEPSEPDAQNRMQWAVRIDGAVNDATAGYVEITVTVFDNQGNQVSEPEIKFKAV